MYWFFRMLDYVLYPLRMVGYYLTLLAPGIKKVGAASTAMKAALLTGFFLGSVAILYGVFSYFSGDFFTEWRVSVVLVLVALITPFAVYAGVRWLSATDVSAFPDIDDAWQAGIEKLNEIRLPIDQVPVQVVLGVGSAARMKSLMAEATLGEPFEVEGVPEGSPPLVWYAADEVIYLGLTGVGAISRSVAESEQPARKQRLRSASGAPAGTLALDDDDDPSDSASVADLVDEVDDDDWAPPTPAAPTIAGRTIDLDEVLEEQPSSHDRPTSGPATRSAELQARVLLEERERLEHVCKLLRKARAPLFPHNGLLMTLPLHAAINAGRSLEPAIRQDLDVIGEELQLRATTSVLVTDLEREAGFLELMRRIGPKHCQGLRFGKGYASDALPTPERLTAVALHACGQFEDFVYSLFGKKKALDKPGNHLLFMLMCKLRGRFRTVFVPTIANAIGVDEEGGSLPVMFGGVYFAGTGDTPEQRSFLRAVFQKMDDNRLEVEWSDDAIGSDEWYQNAANALTLVALAIVIAISVWWWRKPSADAVGAPPSGTASVAAPAGPQIAHFPVQPGGGRRDNRTGPETGPPRPHRPQAAAGDGFHVIARRPPPRPAPA